MANTITSQVISKGPKTITIKVDILGDGSGDESKTAIIAYTDYTDTRPDTVDLLSLQATMYGFTATLNSDVGLSKRPIISVSPNSPGISVRGSTAHNAIPIAVSGLGGGKILMTTYGLGANDHGTLILNLRLDAS